MHSSKLEVQISGVILLMVYELNTRYSRKSNYGLTTPLITLASGKKMGKTETGAIWLDKNYLSPYDYLAVLEKYR